MNTLTVLLAIVFIAALARLVLSESKRKKDADRVKNTTGWVIGPVVRGVNHSVGMPERPTMQGAGWYFDFPAAGGKVDYVQWFDPPTLVGAKRIIVRYAVTGGGFTPFEYPDRPATVGVQFQRNGDNWSGGGKYQSYRWFSRQLLALQDGEFTLNVPLEMAAWGDVFGKSDNQAAFDAALKDMSNLAIVFGHASGGAGHGVFATEPSKFTLLGIEVLR